MKSGETFMEENGDVEEIHHLRLMVLLHDLVRKKGRRGAARELGIDRRTVAACMDGGGMSWRMRESLERGLQSGAGSAAARQRKRNEALEQRVEGLEGRMEGLGRETRGGLETAEGKISALRDEHAQGMGQVERRLARVEAQQDAQGAAEAPGVAEKPKASVLERRRYPELVTKDPAPDDEEVYGAAWPLIEEWRGLWKSHHSNRGGSLSWLATEERIRELEVAMLEEHGLTLPPETEPLQGLWRRSQLNWRKEALYDTRRARGRREMLRWLRRVLTLGLWWK